MLKESSSGSDLTERQWRLVEKQLPKAKKRGRKPTDRRWVVDAILYVAVTGCQWRQLPHDFPKRKTVYNTFWAWRRDGVIERVHDASREKARQAAGKKPTPSVAIGDSQSVRTGEGGEQRGYDAAKKITGRKRHIAVDCDSLPHAGCQLPAPAVRRIGGSLLRDPECSSQRRMRDQ